MECWARSHKGNGGAGSLILSTRRPTKQSTMASYGKKSYWNERYSRETEPCDWIVEGFGVFQLLLTPTFLENTRAPPPGGEIVVRGLNTWAAPQCPSLVSGDGFDFMEERDESSRQHESPWNTGVVRFPSKERCRVLHVGCGNSQLGEHLLHGGWRDVTNVDYSEVVVKKMLERYGERFFAELQSCLERDQALRSSLGLESRDDINHSDVGTNSPPKMTFEVGDIIEGLHYPNGSFDLIICKKTLDVVLCGAGSVADARSMLNECFRLLDDDYGVMVILSSAKPEDRAVYFEGDVWAGVENIKLPSQEYSHFDHRKGHEKKKVESYVYILYKQNWRTQQVEDI